MIAGYLHVRWMKKNPPEQKIFKSSDKIPFLCIWNLSLITIANIVFFKQKAFELITLFAILQNTQKRDSMTTSKTIQTGTPTFNGSLLHRTIFSGIALFVFFTFTGISGENTDRTFDYILVFDGSALIMEDHQTTISMGEVRMGAICQRTIQVKNTSDVPLWITNVRGSCGLSVPTWPRTQLQPGSVGAITVRYDSSRPGEINRSLTIVANTENASTIFKVTGMILKPATSP